MRVLRQLMPYAFADLRAMILLPLLPPLRCRYAIILLRFFATLRDDSFAADTAMLFTPARPC